MGRSPGEGIGYPLQYSGLKNSMECIVHGSTKSQTRLNDFPFPLTIDSTWHSHPRSHAPDIPLGLSIPFFQLWLSCPLPVHPSCPHPSKPMQMPPLPLSSSCCALPVGLSFLLETVSPHPNTHTRMLFVGELLLPLSSPAVIIPAPTPPLQQLTGPRWPKPGHSELFPELS